VCFAAFIPANEFEAALFQDIKIVPYPTRIPHALVDAAGPRMFLSILCEIQ
jgi:hypothetical protein